MINEVNDIEELKYVLTCLHCAFQEAFLSSGPQNIQQLILSQMAVSFGGITLE